MTSTESSEKDIIRRINQGLYKFSELRAVWAQREISQDKTGPVTQKDNGRLNLFHTKKLRALLGRRREEINNKNLFTLTEMCEFEMSVGKARGQDLDT